MVDFGLMALIALVLIAAGVVLWAFSSMKREVSSNAALEAKIQQALDLAAEAKLRADQVEVENYNRLAKRLDGLDVKLSDAVREVDSQGGRLRTVQATVAGMKRWDKKAEPDPEEPPIPNFFAPPGATPAPAPAEPKKHFGRKVA